MDLKNAIVAADRLLIATPESNNSIPGVAMSALDWTTRPHLGTKRVLEGKSECDTRFNRKVKE
ncbi:MAG: NAD(P)H-dependent oxidoreductase [Planctomycetota bacterium]